MAKTPIKVGDMVKRKSTHLGYNFAKDNGPFKVVRVYDDHTYGEECLEFDRGPNNSTTGGWHARLFDVVEVAPTGPWIIVLKGADGTFKPAPSPRVLTSQAQAKAVAASMAEKHPGQEFFIFEAVGKAKTTAATVEMF
jgi:hypothetical protein